LDLTLYPQLKVSTVPRASSFFLIMKCLIGTLILHWLNVPIKAVISIGVGTSVVAEKNSSEGNYLSRDKYDNNVVDDCPCSDPSWCRPIQIPLYSRKEVYGFSLKTDKWKDYDWSVITTMAWFDKIQHLPLDLICWAHRHNARVVFTTSIPENILTNTSTLEDQRRWAQELVDKVDAVGGDGLNLDYENPVESTDTQKQQAITYITNEIQFLLKKSNPYSSLVWDFGWKPGVDVRFYEYQRMADLCDFVFIMVYDTQSQVWDGPPCLADANSPISAVRQSLQWYGIGEKESEHINHDDSPSNESPLKIPFEKLLLGLPWYGYFYHCISFDHTTQQCTIPAVPFRGAPCSDAAGRQIDYPFTLQALEQSKTDGIMDMTTLSMKAFVKDDALGNVTAYYYDSPDTLRDKIAIAWGMTGGRLGGVGVWNADVPNYTDTNQGKSFWQAMKFPPASSSGSLS
jgi:Di-N-acetylchitobiase